MEDILKGDFWRKPSHIRETVVVMEEVSSLPPATRRFILKKCMEGRKFLPLVLATRFTFLHHHHHHHHHQCYDFLPFLDISITLKKNSFL